MGLCVGRGSGPVPDHRCMLAHSFDPVEIGERPVAWYAAHTVEPKIDGVRCLIVAGEALSRSGKRLYHLDWVLSELRSLVGRKIVGDWVFDGELWAGSWNGTVSICRAGVSDRSCENLDCVVFDVLPVSHWQMRAVYPERYRDRHRRLVEWLRDGKRVRPVQQDPWHSPLRDMASVRRVLSLAKADGYEGVMLKQWASPYEFRRSPFWLKVVSERTLTVRVVGLQEGKGKYRGMVGALKCVLPDGKEVRVSGMTDEQRMMFWARPETVVGSEVEVSYRERTQAGALRFPQFVRVRDHAVEG